MDTNLAPAGRQNQPENLDRTMKFKFKRRLRLEIELAGGRQKPLAYETATDEGALSRMLSERCEDALPAHKLPAVTGELGPGTMEWLALQCGGVYHHGEEIHYLKSAPLALVGMLANLSGKSVQQLIQDFQDHQDWTQPERQADLPNLRKLRAVVETLIHDAEGVKP